MVLLLRVALSISIASVRNISEINHEDIAGGKDEYYEYCTTIRRCSHALGALAVRWRESDTDSDAEAHG